jgi:hypothetical protein
VRGRSSANEFQALSVAVSAALHRAFLLRVFCLRCFGHSFCHDFHEFFVHVSTHFFVYEAVVPSKTDQIRQRKTFSFLTAKEH